MHSKSVESLSLTRAGFIEYFLVATKLVHALTAIAPALFLLYYPGLVPVELRSNMLGLLLFFGALTVIMFQALDVYSDDIFSNRLRFRIMFFAWASAFCLLLFMYQGLGLFPYLSSKLVIFWFTGSLLLFGVQRLLVLRLYRAWMKRGMYLQRTVILGFTESGMHLAEYLVRNHDIRSGIIGFIDDRSERVPENYNSLPLHPQDQHRRAAAAVQRARRQHVDGRPAPPRHRDQGRRHSLRGGGQRIQLAPPGQARHHRLGADQRLPG